MRMRTRGRLEEKSDGPALRPHLPFNPPVPRRMCNPKRHGVPAGFEDSAGGWRLRPRLRPIHVFAAAALVDAVRRRQGRRVSIRPLIA